MDGRGATGSGGEDGDGGIGGSGGARGEGGDKVSGYGSPSPKPCSPLETNGKLSSTPRTESVETS